MKGIENWITSLAVINDTVYAGSFVGNLYKSNTNTNEFDVVTERNETILDLIINHEHLYVLTSNNIFKIENGKISTVITNIKNKISNIKFDDEGNIYGLGILKNRIYKIDFTINSLIKINLDFEDKITSWVFSNSNLFIGVLGGEIWKFNLKDSSFRSFAVFDDEIKNLMIDTFGNIYVVTDKDFYKNEKIVF